MFRLLILFITYSIGFPYGETAPDDIPKNSLLVNCPEERSIALNHSLSLLDYDKLLQTKAEINFPKFKLEYKRLLQNADQALMEGPFSVVDKTQVSPSGDKHDYISYGPYWWPDRNKEDGLPWIRKDGEVNPLARESNTDYKTKEKMFTNTFQLTLAYFFSDNVVYGIKAVELIKTWFIKDATKMNPNLQYAQGIPGINEGRGIGIIELADITNIISSIEILEIKGLLDINTRIKLRNWFTEYLNWLQTSEHGIFEKNTKNNHAIWYDVQVVSILMFLDRAKEAQKVLEDVKTKRIKTQIMPDGRQPHELDRTKSLSYSTMNLRGFTHLAYYGKKLGVDLWNYVPEGGGGIQKAYEFLLPYAKGNKKWEYQQIASLSNALSSLRKLFLQAGSQFDNDTYCTIGNLDKGKEGSLIYNCF